MSDEVLVTVAEAARRLSISRATVYVKLASGELSSVAIGRARRVPVAALEAFVARLLSEASGGM
jgi:excisionase family DNA binding protein